MSILVGGRRYRTLDDRLYVGGSQVQEVYANGVKVYPEKIDFDTTGLFVARFRGRVARTQKPGPFISDTQRYSSEIVENNAAEVVPSFTGIGEIEFVIWDKYPLVIKALEDFKDQEEGGSDKVGFAQNGGKINKGVLNALTGSDLYSEIVRSYCCGYDYRYNNDAASRGYSFSFYAMTDYAPYSYRTYKKDLSASPQYAEVTYDVSTYNGQELDPHTSYQLRYTYNAWSQFNGLRYSQNLVPYNDDAPSKSIAAPNPCRSMYDEACSINSNPNIFCYSYYLYDYYYSLSNPLIFGIDVWKNVNFCRHVVSGYWGRVSSFSESVGVGYSGSFSMYGLPVCFTELVYTNFDNSGIFENAPVEMLICRGYC